MLKRSTTTCEIKCAPCTGDRYTESDNVEMSCNICTTCLQREYFHCFLSFGLHMRDLKCVTGVLQTETVLVIVMMLPD